MKLSEIFAKDVERAIEGVIKADDRDHLSIEIDEYVLTNEVAKGLESLLEEYTNYSNANGVWISGFFGSGKSHLLKMLAYLLGEVSGQPVDRAKVVEKFRAKATGGFLPALLEKSAAIPARSILFNIDQKANLIAKDQTDALLKVFVKVFDESRGFYGNQGHVARFERDLVSRGEYESFQAAYERIAQHPWSQGREQTMLEGSSIDRAFAEVSGNSATDIIKQYQATYAVSIDQFAEEVKSWLDGMPEGYRLNFFVDEVGQFIADNTNLMLNLQTIAETLAAKCKGRAWVMVTSQEDMDKVVGDRSRAQGNDFSKIQARFKARLKLTSADVEEVIRKRLLEKNEQGALALRGIYAEESANFGTLFNFSDGSMSYRVYTDVDHFVGTYPFVSYQFPLFQASIQGISEHNAFEGRHSSVGERSMLGVIQEVAKRIRNLECGSLAGFDQLYEGIRSSLKSAAQNSILLAERNLDNALAIRLLKALFLVKYVETFHATPRNLTVLVYDKFGMDLPALSLQVQEALAQLESQTYVQRRGNVYEYLTSDEKLIEEEIKNVDIDASEMSNALFKILSGDIFRNSKIEYEKNGQPFAFGFRLDDQVFGIQRELTLHFITPEYPHPIDVIRMHSAGKDELRVVLASDSRIFNDLRLRLKTEKYVKRKQGTNITPIQEQILRTKVTQNGEREKEIVQRLQVAIGQSTLVINGADVPVQSTNALDRVAEGLQELIRRTYTQLSLLGGRVFTEQHLADALDPQNGLFGVDDDILKNEAAQEVLAMITRKQNIGEQVTVKAVVDAYEVKPYGWDLASTEVVIAALVGAAKITVMMDGNLLKRSEIAAALRNTHKHSHQVLQLQKSFDQGKISDLRKFFVEFFDDGSAPSDPLELSHRVGAALKVKRNELASVVASSTYPFIDQLNGVIDALDRALDKPDDWYLQDFDFGDELIDAKLSFIDPIQAFLNGMQRPIYDAAASLLVSQSGNLEFLEAGCDSEVQSLLSDPDVYRGGKVAQLKTASDKLRTAVEEVVASRKAEVVERISSRTEDLKEGQFFAGATGDAQSLFVAKVEQMIRAVQDCSQVAAILQLRERFESQEYPSLIDLLARSAVEGSSIDDLPKQAVSIRAIEIDTTVGVLESESDVDEYLGSFRKALMQAIADQKRIVV